MYESVSNVGIYYSGSADSVVAGSVDLLLFVVAPYTIDLLCSLRFIFSVV